MKEEKKDGTHTIKEGYDWEHDPELPEHLKAAIRRMAPIVASLPD